MLVEEVGPFAVELFEFRCAPMRAEHGGVFLKCGVQLTSLKRAQ